MPAPNPVYDANGAPLVTDDQVSKALADGSARFRASDVINMVKPDGTVVGVSGDEAWRALQSRDADGTPSYRLESGGETQLRQHKEEHGGDVGEAALTFGEHALSTGTVGISDELAAIVGGPEYTEGRRLREATHPVAGIAGDVAAIAASLPKTAAQAGAKGAAALARDAAAVGTAPARAVSALGGLAERGAAKLLGAEATSAAGQLAQRGGALAARGLVEGGIFGAGQAMSEAALGDKELTAEMLWAGMKHGATLGAVLGPGVGGLSVAAERAAPVLARGLRSVARGSELRAAGAAGSDLGRIMQQKVAGGEARIARLVDTAKRVTGATDTLAERGAKFAREARAAGEEIGALRKTLDDIDAKATAAGQASAARGAVTAMLGDADELVGKLRQGVEKEKALAGTLEKEWLGDLREMATGAKPATFAKLQHVKEQLRREVAFDKKTFSQAEDAHTALSGMLETHVETAADALASASGDAKFLARYQDAKVRYADFSELWGLNQKARGLSAGDPTLSPDEILTGTVGAVSGGPQGILAGLAHKVLSSSPASGILSRAAEKAATVVERLSGAARMADAVSRQLEAGVKRAVKVGPRGGKATALGTSVATTADPYKSVPTRVALLFDKHAQQAREWRANPQRAAGDVAARVAPFADVAPKTARAMALAAVTTAGNLAQRVPGPAVVTPGSVTRPPPVNAAAKAAYVNFYRASTDPLSVLKDIEKGKLSQDAVDAIRQNSPKLYDRMRAAVTEQLADAAAAGRPVPYQRRLLLERLVGMPLTGTSEPATLSTLQQSYASVPQQTPAAPAAQMTRSQRAPRVAGRRTTEAERLERGSEP